MTEYRSPDEKEVQRINRLQQDFFRDIVHLFDPPLPEGVPERLEKIVRSAYIIRGDVVLDLGSGTGILVPIIQQYEPDRIIACDISDTMLARLKEQYAYADTILADARDITLADQSLDVIFMNACYPNIVDKKATFANIGRMTKSGGRLVISHPMGKSFIDSLREKSTFPLDDFPGKHLAGKLLKPFRFEIKDFVDEANIYIMVAIKK